MFPCKKVELILEHGDSATVRVQVSACQINISSMTHQAEGGIS
jgi:hypothetical protein